MAGVVSAEVLEAFKNMIRDGVGRALTYIPGTCPITFSDLLRNGAEMKEFSKAKKANDLNVLAKYPEITETKQLRLKKAKDDIVQQFEKDIINPELIDSALLQKNSAFLSGESNPARQKLQNQFYKALKKSIDDYISERAYGDTKRDYLENLDDFAKTVSRALVTFVKKFDPDAKEKKTVFENFTAMLQACTGTGMVRRQ